MFRKNEPTDQPYLISNVNDLPEKHRKRLENCLCEASFA